MKRIILLVCFIAVTLGAYSQVTWNLKAGAGLSALEWGNDEGDNSSRIVGKIGVGMEVPLNRNLSFIPSLEFAMKGGKLSCDYWEGTIVVENSAYYAQLPVLFGYRLNLTKSWNMVLKAGPYAAYGLFGKTKQENAHGYASIDIFGDEALSRFDFGTEIGVDFEFRRFVIGFDVERGFGYDDNFVLRI